MVKFRRVTADDREVYLQMVDDFYHSDAVLHDVPHEYFENAFDELMRSDDYLVCYIFDVDGCAAGYALLVKSYSQEVGGVAVWVDELYVKSEYRSKGIGSTFFEFMQNEYPAARYRLEVEPGNTRAVELYKRMGFKPLEYVQLVKDKA